MIKAIFTSPQPKGKQVQHQACTVVANKGIKGDRYFDKQLRAGQNISLISLEEINHYNHRYKQTIAIDQTRRNIIVEGVNLNALVGQEFSFGTIRFKGIELCQPCIPLSIDLASDTIRSDETLAALMNRAGIRATILNDGELRVGMTLTVSRSN